MLLARDVGKSYRGEWLFRSATIQINERDRIGLVGDNGSGKSTLMKMLAHLCPLDEGEIIGARSLTSGYLPQDGLFVRGRTLLEEALSVFEGILDLERECRRLERELSDMRESDPEHENKLERYAAVSQQFRLRGGYSVEARAGAVLNGLGFSEYDRRRRCEDFSGGWQMRIALAKLLLTQPRLLLLDEPTNHLDLEARDWLQQYLQQYPHALVLVSHDRYFLDATVHRIVEIRNRTIHLYKGNYDSFLQQRDLRISQLAAAYEAQQKEIARIRAFADKFRYKASKAAQVQSRLKEIERMERVEIPPESKRIRLRFPEGPRTGRVVLELSNATAGYGAAPVFRSVDLALLRGDRVALVGPNGAGKSTLMKVLAGRLPLSGGERREGQNVLVSYFSQEQDDLLASRRTVWDEVYSVAPDYIVPQLRTLLGCFLFSGDSVEKPVAVLSGGERSRLVLCRLLLSPANCLLLDEPTNHLDLRSKDILMDSLQDYEGTMVFVSHDRYFLDGLATRVIEVGRGTLVAYLGNYTEYLEKKQSERERLLPTADGTAPSEGSSEPGSDERSRGRARKKVNPYKVRELEEKISAVESEIHQREIRVSELAEKLASGDLYRDYDRFRTTMEEHDRLQAELGRLMGDWEKLHARLASFQDDESASRDLDS